MVAERFRSPLLAGLVLWLTLGSGGQAAEVRILNPTSQEAVFGEVQVEVTTTWRGLDRIELLLDERPVGVLYEPPFQLTIDVGQNNREHRFEAIVHGPAGELGRAVVETPALGVHEEVFLDLQQIYVTVSRRNGRRALDLERQDFTLFDEDRAQTIVTFERGDIPFTAILLVDTSSSMAGRKLTAALRGAQAFAEAMTPLDEAKLMLFSDHLLAVSPWSQSREELTAGLEEVAAAGGTALHDFLFLALRELETRQGRRVVVLLSDGRDVHSVLDMDQVRAVARSSQAQIFWVRPRGGKTEARLRNSWRDPRETNRQRKPLATTVEESGGREVPVKNVDKVEDAFRTIVHELREQYALGYYPEPRRNDGRWRPLRIEFERPGLTLRTRAGYVDH